MDMDNHPIPQDVSHFQFKLIGEMTVKQFGYLGAGMVMAWLFMVLPISYFVRVPLAIIYAGAGIILAFVPIEGRPADLMIKNFVKALFAPNQYIFVKGSGDAGLSSLLLSSSGSQRTPTAQQQPPSPQVVTPPPIATPQPPQTPQVAYIQTPTPLSPPSQPAPSPVTAEIGNGNTTQVTQEEKTLAEKADQLEKELEEARSQASSQQGTPAFTQAQAKVTELEESLRNASLQKERLEKEVATLKQQANTNPQQVYSPSTATPPETPNVRNIPQPMRTGVGLPSTPDVPNVITGIVKDSRGNVLPNILIEVKDGEGNPVRAFKTNQLGQFASATPLLNGTYTVFFEDPAGKHSFETVQISVAGEILMPIEVISIDQREELRKELFG